MQVARKRNSRLWTKKGGSEVPSVHLRQSQQNEPALEGNSKNLSIYRLSVDGSAFSVSRLITANPDGMPRIMNKQIPLFEGNKADY